MLKNQSPLYISVATALDCCIFAKLPGCTSSRLSGATTTVLTMVSAAKLEAAVKKRISQFKEEST
jgi:hypothetical protein